MRLLPGRAEKLESAVAILLLLVLIATAVGVYIWQRDVDTGRFGIVSRQASEQPNVQKTNESGPSFGGLATGDFSPAGNVETYDTDNLYEKIDGKAPMYQETGFVKLTTQRFAAKHNSELGFELYQYDMGNARNAFSVYSRQKRADATDLRDLGASAFGYVAGNAICISLGKNYIEMIGSAESNELVDGMKGIAKDMAGLLKPGEKDKIVELGYFPIESTVAGSWRLQIDNAFGFDGLTDTYSAQYKTGEKTVTIFLSRRNNTNEARTVAKNYADFLVTNGAKVIEPNVLDFYGSTEMVFSTGVFVGGVHEADDRQAAKKAAEALIGRLKEIND